MMRATLIFIFCVTIVACTKKDYCLQPGPAFVRCGFYFDDGTNKPADTLLDEVSIFTADTTFRYFDNDTNVGKLNYFIQSKLNEQQIIILYEDPELYDTIWVKYTPILSFISNGCGYQYEYTLDDVRSTNTFIEEVSISNASVNSQSTEEHLEIIIQ